MSELPDYESQYIHWSLLPSTSEDPGAMNYSYQQSSHIYSNPSVTYDPLSELIAKDHMTSFYTVSNTFTPSDHIDTALPSFLSLLPLLPGSGGADVIFTTNTFTKVSLAQLLSQVSAV